MHPVRTYAFSFTRQFLALTALFFISLLYVNNVAAGISYQLDSAHAVAGQTVRVKGILFNDTDSAITWTPPENLVLQWRGEQVQAIRSLAYLKSTPNAVNVPVNNFVAFSWETIVPNAVDGLQAVNIEGDPTLLALDTSPLGKRSIAAAGASLDQVPVASTASAHPLTLSVFENFRNAVSLYEPVYFDIGTKGGTNARFQLSFKYRLSSPEDPKNPAFLDHMYLGYTQIALWDLAGNSKPFIDSTYNPSLFWQKDKLWQSTENKWFVGLTTGVEHKSNGKSGAESRSLNDAFIQPQLNYRFNGGSTLTFAPRIKTYFSKNENPDYADYAGYVDWKLRWAQDNGLILSGLYQHGKKNHSTTQLEAAWPLRRTFLNMNGYLHIQYFKGYGETFLGYKQESEPQIRVGLSLVP